MLNDYVFFIVRFRSLLGQSVQHAWTIVPRSKVVYMQPLRLVKSDESLNCMSLAVPTSWSFMAFLLGYNLGR